MFAQWSDERACIPAPMPRLERSYVVYVDDSGNQEAGVLWTALAIPLEMWSEYLGRWQGFRENLMNKHRLPSGFELHGHAWLSQRPTKELDEGQAELALGSDGEVLPILARERAYAVVMVDGGHDSGGNLHRCHRALEIKTRRIVEDAGLRRSHESHLLQMVDWCAYSAFQAIQDRPNLSAAFKSTYERQLDKLIVRPFEVEKGPCIRGFDWDPSAIPF